MERKVGEIFFAGNVTLQVEKAERECSCFGCYYNVPDGCIRSYDIAGPCVRPLRTDHQFIIFKEIQL